jgi:hypothetical protein
VKFESLVQASEQAGLLKGHCTINNPYLWPTNDKFSSWIQMKDCSFVHVSGWNHSINDLLLEIFTELFKCDDLIMLAGDYDSVNANWNTGTILKSVFSSNLEVKTNDILLVHLHETTCMHRGHPRTNF